MAQLEGCLSRINNGLTDLPIIHRQAREVDIEVVEAEAAAEAVLPLLPWQSHRLPNKVEVAREEEGPKILLILAFKLLMNVREI